MTEKDLIKKAKFYPPITRILAESKVAGVSDDAVVKQAIWPAFNMILVSSDWDFAYRTQEVDSVANQSRYELRGYKDDCRLVYNVRYGSSGRLLTKRSRTWMDDYLTKITISGVGFWVPGGTSSNGYPEIEIISAPSSDGEVIKYRYLRKGVQLVEFPDEFDFVLIDAVAYRIHPVGAINQGQHIASMRPQFERSLKLMKDSSFGGGSVDPAIGDSATTQRTLERNRMRGGWR